MTGNPEKESATIRKTNGVTLTSDYQNPSFLTALLREFNPEIMGSLQHHGFVGGCRRCGTLLEESRSCGSARRAGPLEEARDELCPRSQLGHHRLAAY